MGNSEEVDAFQPTSRSYSTLVGMDQEEISRWKAAYSEDPHFSLVLKAMREDENNSIPFPQYQYSDNRLLYFEDSMGNSRMCVPKGLKNKIMSEGRDIISESAHGGYYKTYNRISGTYYWP